MHVSTQTGPSGLPGRVPQPGQHLPAERGSGNRPRVSGCFLVCCFHASVNPCVQNSQYKTVERVVQTLKNLCCALDEVETQSITEAIKRLRHAANVPRTHSPKVGCDAGRHANAPCSS